jgi:hypothetical protein
MKTPNDPIKNQICDLLAGSTVPQLFLGKAVDGIALILCVLTSYLKYAAIFVLLKPLAPNYKFT